MYIWLFEEARKDLPKNKVDGFMITANIYVHIGYDGVLYV